MPPPNGRFRIRLCDAGDAATLARLHSENVSDRLGMPLLQAYYRACLASRRGFCLCAEVDGGVVGYIGVISDRMELLRIAARRGWATLLASVFERPHLLFELVRRAKNWVRFSMESGSPVSLAEWEYRPVVVAQGFRGLGISPALLAAAEAILANKGAKSVHLWVAASNIRALRIYEKSGFKRAGSHHTSILPMYKNLPQATDLDCVSL